MRHLGEVGGGGKERDKENSNLNYKTLILKDSSVRSIWTYLTERERETDRERERQRDRERTLADNLSLYGTQQIIIGHGHGSTLYASPQALFEKHTH